MICASICSAYQAISLIGLDVTGIDVTHTRAEHFLWSAAAANAPAVPSLTLRPGVLSVANTVDEIFPGQGNVLGLENNLPLSFNQDYDKCFSCEILWQIQSVSTKKIVLFFLSLSSPAFFVNLCRWHKGGSEAKQFSGRQVIIWRLADRQRLLLLWAAPLFAFLQWQKGGKKGGREEGETGWRIGNCKLSI